MWRVTLTGVMAHRLRYTLTALAVLLGVAFIAGTFVLTDTINSTFNGLYDQIYQGTAAVVRATEPFNPGANFTSQRQRIDASLATTVVQVPGVQAAASVSRATPSSSGVTASRSARRPTARPRSAWPGPTSQLSTRCGYCPAGSRRAPAPRWLSTSTPPTSGISRSATRSSSSPRAACHLYHYRHRDLGQRGQPARRDRHRIRPGHRSQSARPARQGERDQRGGGTGVSQAGS